MYSNKFLKEIIYSKIYTKEGRPRMNENTKELDEVRTLSLALGIDAPKDTVTYLYAKKFADEVYDLSNGKIKIDVYTDAELGTNRQMFSTIKQSDNLHFIVQSTSPQVPFLPKLSLFDMPFIYFNIDDLRRVIDNKAFYEKISNIYTEGGYKLLGIGVQLFRHMTSNKEIQNIDDFKGLKIRIIQNHNHEAFWKALGATVVPLPVSEIYPSLRFGLIDAQENPYENIVALNLYKVQKYLVNTYHLPHLLTLITSDKFYNSLSLAEKSIINEAAVKATAYAREKADERFEDLKNFLIENGMTIVDLPYETRLALRAKAMPVYQRIRQIIGEDSLINSYFGVQE